MHAKSLQSCRTPCNPRNCSPLRPLCPWDSPSKNTGVGCHALLQGIFSTQGSNPSLLCLLHWQTGSLPLVSHRNPKRTPAAAAAAAAKSLQSCPTLCDPTDSSPPGSAVPGILQARTLEWVLIHVKNSRNYTRYICSKEKKIS